MFEIRVWKISNTYIILALICIVNSRVTKNMLRSIRLSCGIDIFSEFTCILFSFVTPVGGGGGSGNTASNNPLLLCHSYTV